MIWPYCPSCRPPAPPVAALPSLPQAVDLDEVVSAVGLPRLYRGVVWSDVVADIRDGVTLPNDGTAEHVIPVSTEVPW